jgi:hypothetical protein
MDRFDPHGVAFWRTKKRSHRKTLQSLASYLGKHRWHLDDARRLAMPTEWRVSAV